MKKITQFTLTAVTAIALLASCKNAVIENTPKTSVEVNQTAYLRIGTAKVAYRSLKPNVNEEDITSLVLKGSRSGDENQQNKQLASASSLAELKTQTIELQTGIWDFTLTASLGDYSFSGTVSNVSITAEEENRLSFTLTATENKGEFSIKLIFPYDENLTHVEEILKKANETIDSFTVPAEEFTTETENTRSVTNKKTGADKVEAGDYSLTFNFYADGTSSPINSLDYVVQVQAGFVTAVEQTISLNETFTISFEYDKTDTEISLEGQAVLPSKYSRKTETITLPNLVKENWIFGGWYDNPDLTGNRITEIQHGSTGNKTFYPKWNKQIAIPVIDVTLAVNAENDMTSPSWSEDSVTAGLYHCEAESGYKSYTLTIDGLEYEANSDESNKFDIDFSNFATGIYDIILIAIDDDDEYYSWTYQFSWTKQ